MKQTVKKILSALVLAVFVVVFYGGALLLAVLFAAFTLPPYAQYALWAWAAVDAAPGGSRPGGAELAAPACQAVDGLRDPGGPGPVPRLVRLRRLAGRHPHSG